LDFPDEVLREIFSMLPTPFNVSLSCKWFYEISCAFSKCKMKLGDDKVDGVKFIADEENFRSIINSSRRITWIEFQGKGRSDIFPIQQQIHQIFEKVRDEVEVLEMGFLNLTSNFLPALNLLTNLTTISIKCVTSNPQVFEIDLPNLKVLKLEQCSEGILMLFDSLRDDILHEIIVKDISKTIGRKHLLNQRNIRLACASNEQFLDFKLMKLKRLDLDNPFYLEGIIRNQDELETLTFSDVTGRLRNLNFVVNELKSLHTLHMNLNNPIDFSPLQNAKNLRVFAVYLVCFLTPHQRALSFADGIRSIRSGFIKKLSVSSFKNDVTENLISSLAINCPNVGKLVLDMPRSTFVNVVLLHFPRLEGLTYRTRLQQADQIDHNLVDFEHQNLKEISIESCNARKSYLKDIVKCTNLETAELSMPQIREELSDFLQKQTKIKILLLKSEIKDSKIIATIKKFAKNLAEVELTVNGNNLEKMKRGLEEDFYEFKRVEDHSNCFRLTMRKLKEVN
jgi:hypothetical protein